MLQTFTSDDPCHPRTYAPERFQNADNPLYIYLYQTCHLFWERSETETIDIAILLSDDHKQATEEVITQ